MRRLLPTLCLLASAAALGTRSAAAQRALPASSFGDASRTIRPSVHADTTGERADAWMRRPSRQRTVIRASAAVGLGIVAGVVALEAGHRQTGGEADNLAGFGRFMLGETLGMSVGAALPGGMGHGRCGAGTRQFRSLGGTTTGTLAGIGLAFMTGGIGLPLLPAAQVAGGIVSLRGC